MLCYILANKNLKFFCLIRIRTIGRLNTVQSVPSKGLTGAGSGHSLSSAFRPALGSTERPVKL